MCCERRAEREMYASWELRPAVEQEQATLNRGQTCKRMQMMDAEKIDHSKGRIHHDLLTAEVLLSHQ
jgi:hypothetical protein